MVRQAPSSRYDATRRRFLATTAALGAAGLAGCNSGDDDNNDSDGNETESNGENDSEQPDQVDGEWEGSDATDVETDHPYTSPRTTINLDETDGAVTLSTRACRHQLLGDNTRGGPWELPEVWAWETPETDPSVPGPLLRVTEGTDMELTFDNSEHNRPHTFHVHGLAKDWEDDGVPSTTGVQVNPGEEYTYEITANQPGTHLYHCHLQTQTHLAMGMYGILRVDPVDYEPPDREFFMTLKEWDTRLSASQAGGDVSYSHRNRRPDAYTVNGRCAPYTFHPGEGYPMVVEEGDDVRMHFVNAGYRSHTMHTHNHTFTVVEKDSGTIPESAQHTEDIVNIAPAERKVIEFTADADPGVYAAHCHRVDHAMNGETYPGGMLAGMAYDSELDSEQFQNLLDQSGYEE
jgi:FtsP/CotA-like multicopper oxidase with cupredoxin domain